MYPTQSHRFVPSNVQSNIDIQIAVNNSAQAHLNYKRNKEASKTYHLLYPIPLSHSPWRNHEYHDLVTTLYPNPFPNSVAKFIELSGNDVEYLLKFYWLGGFDDSVETPPNMDSPGQFLSAALDRKSAVGRYKCMDLLANHIGLKLDSVKHETLDRMREKFWI
ncbi:hypothetical protein TWF281_003660 [Arthrobotrys megalospora]